MCATEAVPAPEQAGTGEHMTRFGKVLACTLVLALSACGGSGGDGGGEGGGIIGPGGTGGTAAGGSGGTGGGAGGSGGSGPPRPPPNPSSPDSETSDWDCDGLSDAEEFGTTYPGGGTTSPTQADSDGDGVDDGIEVGRTSSVDPRCANFAGDADPATTTDPTVADTDGDGIADGAEDASGNGRVDAGETDPRSLDSDGDGLPDALEDTNHDGRLDPGETSAALRDTDGDGIPDGVEDRNRNGIVDAGETDPRNPDTDGDGKRDGDEDVNWNGVVDPGETDPLSAEPDRDHDGLLDADEIRIGTDPDRADTDGDGLPDGLEERNGDGVVNAGETDPLSADTDCDGLSDGEEDANHNGRVDAGETDPRARDTDGDLLSDGLERGRTSSPDPACAFVGDADPSSTTDPLRVDTDGDGLRDGMEDLNRNGRVDAADRDTDPRKADTDGDGIPDGQEDRNGNHRVDPGETDPLVPDVDTDRDGITDPVEQNVTGTDPTRADTDGDGLSDGQEDRNQDGVVNVGETSARSADTDCDGLSDGEEDANRNGVVDAGETDPTDPDSDDDGVLDGVELGRTRSPEATCTFAGDADPSTTTDPLDPDTDGDGVADGAEDANHDGAVNAGELDPRNRGDATPTTVAACATNRLAPVTLHAEAAADVVLATRPSYGEVATITAGGAAAGKMVFAAAGAGQPQPMAAFALVKTPAGADAIAEELAVRAAIGGVSSPIVQPFTTWDGYPAVRALYDVSGTGDLKAKARSMVTALLPGATGLLTGNAGVNGPFKLQVETVVRSPRRAVVVASLVRAADYAGDAVWRLDDVANGSALAQAGDETQPACDRFTAESWPKIDFLWVIDNSGSMGDDQTALANAADAMGAQLAGAAIDWRIAVVTTDLDQRGTGQGRLVDFTTDISAFRTAAQPGTNGSGTERGFLPVKCALQGGSGCHSTLSGGHFLPAAANDAGKVRPDATLVVVFVSDEPEQSTASMTVADAMQYFTDWDPHRAGDQTAVLAGILTCDTQQGTGCNDAALSSRYTSVIQGLGGIIGDLSRLDTIGATINAIVNAVIGSTARIELSQAPISASLKVAMDPAGLVAAAGPGCDAADVPRSRSHGFDYDGAHGRISFYGDCRPQSAGGAQVAVSYRTWIDRSADPDGTPEPCGGCAAPLVCNTTTDTCECPSDCGGGAPGPNFVCDTATCSFTCPDDCGGGCGGRLACDTGSCGCACPADCGGPAPGPGFVCDRGSCTWTCDETCGGQPAPGENFVCDRATCTWTCPANCGQPFSDTMQWCDRVSCTLGCAPDCGGVCTGNTACDPAACACTCSQGQTCAPGFAWDDEACACVCDAAQVSCGGNRVANPNTCACECPSDCGGCENGGVCNRSTCMCVQFG